ncbi:MAG: DUF159 family protein [Cytophagaceae bacterium]|nr:DUF159 family protein [Cytophagaceae bacterium]
MCYHYSLRADSKMIEKEFEARLFDDDEFEPRDAVNGFSHAKMPVIIDDEQEDILMFNWGLIPYWAKDDKIKKMTLNARIETVDTKPAFRNSVKNRCLIIADGFYEWQWLYSKGKEKQKYYIKPKNQEIFAFAGIYSNWTNPESGEEVNTYSIVTTEANELMSEIHNKKKRMPVILRKQDRHLWLKQDPIEKFQFPYEVELSAEKV